MLLSDLIFSVDRETGKASYKAKAVKFSVLEVKDTPGSDWGRLRVAAGQRFNGETGEEYTVSMSASFSKKGDLPKIEVGSQLIANFNFKVASAKDKQSGEIYYFPSVSLSKIKEPKSQK